MKLFALFVLLLCPAVAGAQSCEGLLHSYALPPVEESAEWHLALDPAGLGALFYFGAVHSDDPGHEQFEEIAAAYAAFRPTIVFYEGPARPIADSREETIKLYGESGFVRFLAARDSLAVGRLEPDPGAEMQYVLQRFTPEQAMLFYVLREASRLRERKGMGKEEVSEAVATLLERAGSMMDIPFKTVDELAATYSTYWSEPAEWWQAPTIWFTPGDQSEETGGIFTNDVNRASSEFRDKFMVDALSEAVLKGERVFAVVGRNHVPMQSTALRCELADR